MSARYNQGQFSSFSNELSDLIDEISTQLSPVPGSENFLLSSATWRKEIARNMRDVFVNRVIPKTNLEQFLRVKALIFGNDLVWLSLKYNIAVAVKYAAAIPFLYSIKFQDNLMLKDRAVVLQQLKGHSDSLLKAAWLDTPLGSMMMIASDQALCLLEFVERCGLKQEIEGLQKKTGLDIAQGENQIIRSIQSELALYFDGKLKTFLTPLCFFGTPFQQQVWEALETIPLGETRSYGEIAKMIGRPSACRAVAQANGANQLAIVIPCHRVINSSGKLGGYAGGLSRKQWLLSHEKNLT